jgi:protein-tyrosine kinase
MENIRQALERVRALHPGSVGLPFHASPPQQIFESNPGSESRVDAQGEELLLSLAHLESNRIIAHDDADPRSKPFDMLRTQVLQVMDQKNWSILGITSPTPGCGKTVTAVNLAMSIARQPDRSVLLVDLDLRKPQVAHCLGANRGSGVVSVLEGRTSLSDTIIEARAATCRVMVLPAERATSDSSALMVSRPMSAMLQEIQHSYRSHLVIVDLPPMLSSDDALAVLPRLDCLLLVAAAGKSKASEIEECNKHLHSAEVIRVVLNKAAEPKTQYYDAYYTPSPRQRKKSRLVWLVSIVAVVVLALGAVGFGFLRPPG